MERPPRTEAYWPCAVAWVLGTVAAAAFMFAGRGFLLDDAWIHLSYAKSLWYEHTLSYNPGDWETGATSPLWAVVVAPCVSFAEPVVAVKLLGAVLHGAVACVAARIAWQLASRMGADETAARTHSWVALAAGALVALEPQNLYAATSGMETPLASLLLLLAAHALVAGRARAAFAFALLAPWARPELVAPLLVLAATWFVWQDRRTAFALALGVVVGEALWCLANLAVSGYPFPNTYYVKGRLLDASGLLYFARVVAPTMPWVLSLSGVALFAVALRADMRRTRPLLAPLALAAVVGVLAIALSRSFHPGILFWQWRYFVPVLPMFVLVVPFGLMHVARRWMVYAALTPMLLATLWSVAVGVVVYGGQADDTELHVDVARWLAANVPSDATVGVEAAGASRYFTPRSMRIVDLEGLNDAELAHVRFDPARRLDVIRRRRPTHLAVPHAWVPALARVFPLRPLVVFSDPERWDGVRHGAVQVEIYEVVRAKPDPDPVHTHAEPQVGTEAEAARSD